MCFMWAHTTIGFKGVHVENVLNTVAQECIWWFAPSVEYSN